MAKWSSPPTAVIGRMTGKIKSATARGLQVASDEQSERIRESFFDEGSRDGGPEWPITTEIAAENRQIPSSQFAPDFHTLIDTGNLQGSIRSIIVDIDEQSVESGVMTNVSYAAGMHFGTTFEGHPVPERPFMFLTDQDRGRIVKRVKRELSNARNG